MNIRGQTGLTRAKQVQIETFLTTNNLDVLHLQEINIVEDSFSNCETICSSFNILSNNAASKYGTASLIKTDLISENILMDIEGRAIVFNIGSLTCANLYLPSGTDGAYRNKRENFFSETIPQLLLNRLDNGLIGGDMNCITHNIDCTHHPESKKSPTLSRLIKTCWTPSGPSSPPRRPSVTTTPWDKCRGLQGLIDPITGGKLVSRKPSMNLLPFLIIWPTLCHSASPT